MDHLIPPAAAAYANGAYSLGHGLPLIGTKLGPPRAAGTQLLRTRLLDTLDGLHTRTVALVCGGAGFGKTTLLSQWRQRLLDQDHDVAWLSLDEQDDSPDYFRRYLLAALGSVEPSLSDAAEPLSIGAAGFIRSLINHLSSRLAPLYLVLDDAHLVSHPLIEHDLLDLVLHAPACLHLAVGSRTATHLPLSRLRARQQLVEIDANQLRFTLDEAEDYFARATELHLDAAELQHLLRLTEGWITGMQMACLSTPVAADPTGRWAHLERGSRVIGSYLQDVVLAPLPAEVQRFLLQTSVLNRFTAALCNAVTGLEDGERMLAFIERHNLFISCLDAQGQWFRYHALFAETLQQRLHTSDVDVASLHQRASNWLAAHQQWAEAIRHALAAGQLANSTACADKGAQSLAEEGDVDTLVRWLHNLPASARLPLDEQRIDLQLNLSWALAHRFRYAESRQLLVDLRPLLAQPGVSPRLLIKRQVICAINESFAEHISHGLTLVEPLLAQIPCGDRWVDGLVCNILSYGYLVRGRHLDAQAVQRHMPCPSTPAENLFVSVYRAFILGLSQIRQADLAGGEHHYRQALTHAEQLTGAHSSGSATLTALLAELWYERGDWAALTRELQPRLPQIDATAPLDALFSAYRALARSAVQAGDSSQAMRWLEHAQQLATLRRWPRLQGLLLAEQVRVQVLATAPDHARQLLQQLTELTTEHQADADLHRALQACQRTGQAWLLSGQGQHTEAAQAWALLVADDERDGQLLPALRVRAQWALSLWCDGKTQRATEALLPVLALGQRQGLQQTLLDAGPSIAPLLEACLSLKPSFKDYVQQLLQTATGAAPGLTLILSERESQTLQLVARGQSNKEIARSLAISSETVKWHLKNLYVKLQVTSRIQAMHRARALSLLD
ncbi:LuxR C-terminal-related transcriptional regulator [Pseudomonas sp.]|uniref:LuxR C-terminal-related transcriptional regulator n=1 Tax=Pseudomonas sp. TaxID=306 RepID=UPI0028ACA8ED|nr:LuxR C-terminal-related transcriptional regulator [Pseudomonas sp.]